MLGPSELNRGNKRKPINMKMPFTFLAFGEMLLMVLSCDEYMIQWSRMNQPTKHNSASKFNVIINFQKSQQRYFGANP